MRILIKINFHRYEIIVGTTQLELEDVFSQINTCFGTGLLFASSRSRWIGDIIDDNGDLVRRFFIVGEGGHLVSWRLSGDVLAVLVKDTNRRLPHRVNHSF